VFPEICHTGARCQKIADYPKMTHPPSVWMGQVLPVLVLVVTAGLRTRTRNKALDKSECLERKRPFKENKVESEREAEGGVVSESDSVSMR
jgi:hypothetical protein